MDMREEPWAKYMNQFDYVEFGGNHDEVENDKEVDVDYFYDITNEQINCFDHATIDEHDIMSLSEDSLELSEEDEVNEYCSFLNLPSHEYALNKVGTNELLQNWVEKNVTGMDDKTIAQYEKLSFEIEKVDRGVKVGFEVAMQYFLHTDMEIKVTRETVGYCRKLFINYATVVFDTALILGSLRDEQHISLEILIAALKSLGRQVYYDKVEDEELENETFFDPAVIRILSNIVFGDIKVEEDVYVVLQNSFEDFFSLLISNACQIHKEYEQDYVNEEDLKVVLSLWQNSPFQSSYSLVKKLSL